MFAGRFPGTILARPAIRGAVPVAIAVSLLMTAGAPGARALAPAYNIYELQHSGPELDWKSPHEGEIVQCVGGIVTHKFQQRIVLQDPSLGREWAAIEVRGYPVYPTGIEIGDQVDFDSVYVDEFRGVTTLQYYNASSHVVNSSGQELPSPVSLTVWDVRYPAHPENTERLAAMLVMVNERMTIGAMDLGAHQDNYELLGTLGETAWGSDYANTEIDSTYHVSGGQCFARITGIVQRYDNDAEWDYYQLLPRMNADYVPCGTAVEPGPDAAAFRLCPLRSNPTRRPAGVRYELARGARIRLEVLDAAGRRVGLLADGWREPGWHEATWSAADVPAGVYFVRLRAAGEALLDRLCLVP